MTVFRRSFLVTLACASSTVGLALAQEEKKVVDTSLNSKQLEGIYQIVSGEHDGQPIPADRLKNGTARISDDRFTVYDAEKKETYVASYKLLGEQPSGIGGHKIAMKTVAGPADAKVEEAVGLIKKEGDTVTLIYAPSGGEPPAEYGTKPGTKQNLFILKKHDDDPPKP